MPTPDDSFRGPYYRQPDGTYSQTPPPPEPAPMWPSVEDAGLKADPTDPAWQAAHLAAHLDESYSIGGVIPVRGDRVNLASSVPKEAWPNSALKDEIGTHEACPTAPPGGHPMNDDERSLWREVFLDSARRYNVRIATNDARVAVEAYRRGA